MTYYLYDSQGYIGDLATTKGLIDLSKYLRTRGTASRELASKGFTTKIEQLKEELKTMKSPVTSTDSVIKNLRNLINNCQDIVIITDGTF